MPTSIAAQTVEQLGGRWSVLAIQQRDHIHLDRLLLDLEKSSGERQEELLRRVCRLVFPHAFAEESVLWPILRRALPDGEELTLTVEEEHQQVSELVGALDAGTPDDPNRQELIPRLIQVLTDDVRDEEDLLLPRLQQAVSPKELRRLGVVWEVVRRTAPSRPHPAVARRPPGNVIAALPLTVIDRSRDVLDYGAARTSGGTSVVLRSLSRLLVQGASRVEGLALMGRGEHRSTHRPGSGPNE
jgi:hemerythrin superfamily protein